MPRAENTTDMRLVSHPKLGGVGIEPHGVYEQVEPKKSLDRSEGGHDCVVEDVLARNAGVHRTR